MLSKEFLTKFSKFMDPEPPKEEGVVHVSSIEKPENSPEIVLVEPDTEDHTEHDTMISPLQQDIELKKKEVEVPSWFDTNDGETKSLGDEKALSSQASDVVDAVKALAKLIIRK